METMIITKINKIITKTVIQTKTAKIKINRNKNKIWKLKLNNKNEQSLLIYFISRKIILNNSINI
jgi:hypothetical protein